MNVAMSENGGRLSRETRTARTSGNLILWILPAVFLTTVAIVTAPIASWVRMWTFAFAVYFACKAWVLLASLRNGLTFELRNLFLFVFAWAGMQPEPFAREASASGTTKEIANGYAEGFIKLALGVGVFLIGPVVQARFGNYVAVWFGISAYILILHFGILHLIAVAFQRQGYSVELIMQRPARSVSLADFWSRRWNRAFRDVCHILIIRPTRRLLGPAGAMGLVFIASGLVHELIMSVPAGGMFGGPFAYFTIQIPGLMLERTNRLKSVMRRNVWLGHLWTAVWVIGPLGLLVNDTFVQNVLIPFFKAVGAMS